MVLNLWKVVLSRRMKTLLVLWKLRMKVLSLRNLDIWIHEPYWGLEPHLIPGNQLDWYIGVLVMEVGRSCTRHFVDYSIYTVRLTSGVLTGVSSWNCSQVLIWWRPTFFNLAFGKFLTSNLILVLLVSMNLHLLIRPDSVRTASYICGITLLRGLRYLTGIPNGSGLALLAQNSLLFFQIVLEIAISDVNNQRTLWWQK